MGGIFDSGKQKSNGATYTTVDLPTSVDQNNRATGDRATSLMYDPYQAYTGQRVADQNGWQQQAGMQLAGLSGYTPSQVAPTNLSQVDLSAYQNPYQQSVIDSTISDINRNTAQAQAQQTSAGVTQAGFGGFGDRSAVASGEIQRASQDNMARTVAGLRQAGYANAQQAAQQDISNNLQAQQFNVNAGLQGQQQGIQANLALSGLGGQYQANQQAALDAQYQAFDEARNDPYLKTQWASGIVQGSATPYRGQGNSQGNTTTPSPSIFAGILGAASTGAGIYGAMKAAGGLVGYAGGGYVDLAGRYIPDEGDVWGVSGLNRDQSQPGLAPLIGRGVEAIPMTDAYRPVPEIPGQPSSAPAQPGLGVRSEPVAAVPVTAGLGGLSNTAPVDVVDPLPLPPPQAPAVPEVAPQQVAAPVAAQPMAQAPTTPDADVPSSHSPQVEAALSRLSPSAAAPATPARGDFFDRLGAGLTDPSKAGSQFLIHTGLGIMASRNPQLLGAIGEGGQAGLAAVERMRPELRQQREDVEARRLLGSIGTPVDTAPAVSPPLARRTGVGRTATTPTRAAPLTQVAVPPAAGGAADASFLDRLQAAESGGNPTARNPRSSATGAFQFIDGTWNQYAAANPDRFQGMSPDQILSRRSDPAESRRAAEWYAGQNRDALSAAGVPSGPGELALAHFAGAGGATALLRADPSTPAGEVLGAGAARANPQIANQTAGQVVQSYRSRYGRAADPEVVQVADRSGQAPTQAAAESVAQRDDAAPATVTPTEEPSIVIGNRRITRNDLINLQASAPNSTAVRRLVETALPMLNQQAARQESAATRRDAAADAAANRAALLGSRPPTQTELERTVSARNALPEGSPDRATYDARIGQLTGVNAAERITPQQRADLRLRTLTQARQEAAGLDFSTEDERTRWINQRAAEARRDAGIDDAGAPTRPAGSDAVNLAGGDDATVAPPAARIRPRQPPPQGYRYAADGTSLETIPGGPQDPAQRNLTEAQSKANLFGSNMLRADDILRGAQIPNSATMLAWRAAPTATNIVMGENDQQYFNAVRLFAAGVLRKESGQAFGRGELEDIQSRYFPAPGDSPAVIRQKAESRRAAIEGLRAEIPGGFRGVTETRTPQPQGSGNRPPLDSFFRR